MSNRNGGKRGAALVVACASLAVMSGCAGGSSDSESSGAGGTSVDEFQVPAEKEGTISVITKYGNVRYQPYFDSIVEEYEKENPGVSVDMQAVGDQDYKTKIRVLASSGELPDIYFAWPGAFAEQFVDAGYAADLSPVLSGTEWGDSFASSALSALEYDGKDYGVPLTLDAKVWVYNKQAFADAGLEVPTSFEALVDSCGTFKKSGYENPIAFGNEYGWPGVHFLTQLNAQQVPADVLHEDYLGEDPQFTDPGYVKALENFQELVVACMGSGLNAVSDETANTDFMNGKSVMKYLNTSQFGNLSVASGAPEGFEDEWSFFRMPSIEGAGGDQGALAAAPDALMVNSASTNKALAVDFLKFLTSKENGTRMLNEIGWVSSVMGSADDADTIPQQHEVGNLIDEASSLAIWLDTATPADVSQAYLAGVEGMLTNNPLTPEQVMESVRQAAQQ